MTKNSNIFNEEEDYTTKNRSSSITNANDDNVDSTMQDFSRQMSATPIEDHDEFVISIKHKIRIINVEPLVFCYIVIMYLQMSIMQQYIYYRVGKDYGIVNSTSAYVCTPNSTDSGEKDKVDQIQSINANYGFLNSLSNSICTIIFAPFYSVFSDRYGRCKMLVLPGIGVFIKSIIDVLIIYFEWPIWIFIITEGFYGCFGGFTFAMGVCFSYLADISTSSARTKRMAIMSIMVAVGALLVSLVSGIWIKIQHYLIPYIFTTAVSFLCVIYPAFILQEPPKMVQSDWVKLPPLKQIKNLFTIYWGRPKKETYLLILLMIMFNFYYVAEMSGFTLLGSYLMAYPICMSVMNLSVFSFINIASMNIGIVISLFLLTRLFSDLTIVIICIFCGLIFSIQMAVATTITHVYIAAICNLLSFSAFPFIRGYLSKKMSPSQQGALFGGLVLFETIGSAITKVVVIYFYQETFKIYHGMVYFFIACFSVIGTILAICAKVLETKINRMNDYHSINE